MKRLNFNIFLDDNKVRYKMMDDSTEMDPSLPLNDDSLTPQVTGQVETDAHKGEGQVSFQ